MVQTTYETKNVAVTIREQIGEGALFMLGAYNFLCGEHEGMPYLSFRIRGSRRGNFIRICLHGSDTYQVELGKVHGLNFRIVDEREMVYADRLRYTIEAMTGLRTSL